MGTRFSGALFMLEFEKCIAKMNFCVKYFMRIHQKCKDFTEVLFFFHNRK